MKNMFDLYGLSVIRESLPLCRRNCQLKPRNDYENKSTKSLICKKIIYRKTCYKQKREREKKENRGQINTCIYILNICINCSATYDFFFFVLHGLHRSYKKYMHVCECRLWINACYFYLLSIVYIIVYI